ncbi:MAG: NAD-dependent epimerase [Bacteriovorax sp.]|nr:NAD-dependent epimerase [Bacteriovorax sp.]
MKILVTGAAGFIGMHVAKQLLELGHEVVGLDNLNNYYDVQLKQDRLNQLIVLPGFRFLKMDIADQKEMENLFVSEKFQRVVNLAAQPGVRYSIQNPHAYINSNIVGFMNILEGCRHNNVEHLVYASSSSVYGANTKMPFSVHDNVDHPISLYAATKKSNELMAHTYSHLYGLPTTGLRFFTVYGPWGRPDMSPTLFATAISDGKPINVFNEGKMQRDFTYVDDIVEGVVRVLAQAPKPNPNFNSANSDASSSSAPYRLYNIGNHRPVELLYFIEILENAIGKKASKKMLPMQPGDVLATYADIDDLNQAVGFAPHTKLEDGVVKFVEWFKGYYENRK